MEFTYLRLSELMGGLDISVRFEALTVRVESACVCYFPPEGVFAHHMHSFYEFHYIIEGYGTVDIEGREYRLSPGDLYAVAPGKAHRQTADPLMPMVEYGLQCEIRLDELPEASDAFTRSEYAALSGILRRYASTVVQDKHGTGQAFDRLFTEAEKKRAGYLTAVKTLILQIVLTAARNYEGSSPVVSGTSRRMRNIHRIEEINRYIHNNISRPITCKSLAAHLFISTRQLERIVRGQTNYSVHDYILFHRIQKIQSLLTATGDRLAVIAEKTGFSSEFHLSRAFKNWTGVSPAQFREKGSSKHRHFEGEER